MNLPEDPFNEIGRHHRRSIGIKKRDQGAPDVTCHLDGHGIQANFPLFEAALTEGRQDEVEGPAIGSGLKKGPHVLPAPAQPGIKKSHFLITKTLKQSRLVGIGPDQEKAKPVPSLAESRSHEEGRGNLPLLPFAGQDDTPQIHRSPPLAFFFLISRVL
jgi:hypothetical protein